MKITCLIIDDEPLARRKLNQYAEKVSFLQVLGSFGGAVEAIGFLQAQPVDLLLLDIRMDDLTGIELLEALPQRPEVILCTAYEEYALKGYDLQVADYLLKPFSFERFLQAVLAVQSRLANTAPAPAAEFVFIKTEFRLQKVDLKDILFIEGMGDFRRVHCIDRSLLTQETFGALEAKLPGRLFCRVHRSYLVALGRIDSVERDRIRIGDQAVPVSETYRQEFYRRLG